MTSSREGLKTLITGVETLLKLAKFGNRYKKIAEALAKIDKELKELKEREIR